MRKFTLAGLLLGSAIWLTSPQTLLAGGCASPGCGTTGCNTCSGSAGCTTCGPGCYPCILPCYCHCGLLDCICHGTLPDYSTHCDDWVNCNCQGQYKYPVPPLYTYHWRGQYSSQLMTDYHGPWRFPPLKPYVPEPAPGEDRYYVDPDHGAEEGHYAPPSGPAGPTGPYGGTAPPTTGRLNRRPAAESRGNKKAPATSGRFY